MKQIQEYVLDTIITDIELPRDHKVVFVACKNTETVVWIEFDPEGPWKMPKGFHLVSTNDVVPEGGAHVGSALLPNGAVWHVYEV